MKHPCSRAHRRHHRARVIEKRTKLRASWFTHLVNDPDRVADLARAQARLADTGTPCSCEMCGNPRKYFGHRTRAEDRADLALKDEQA